MLKDFIDFNPRETLPKGQPAKKVAMEKLRPFCRDIEEFEVAKYSGGTKFRNGDTLLARITPCLENGKTAQVRFLNDGEVGFGSTEYIVLRAKEGVSDSDYIYYLSTSPKFREIAIQSMVGSSGRQRVQQDVLEKAELHIPPLDGQKKIAEILSALDDKIELNNKINRNLEAQAQAIFKSWFIDFEPFGGSMPKRWKIGNLLDIATYLNGLSMQKYKPRKGISFLPVLKIRELRQGFCDKDSDICSTEIGNEFIIDDGDIVFSWSGTLLINIWCAGKCGLNQHLFKVFSKKYDKWFYYLWTKHYLPKFTHIASGKATTMGHIKREDLEKAKVLIPSKEEYLYLSRIMSPIINRMIQNRLESVNIVKLRDMLLPKLMSGEILIS